MASSLSETLMGNNESGLEETVSLSAPLTAAPIVGREAVNRALRAYAEAMNVRSADLELSAPDSNGRVFSGSFDGRIAQTLAIATESAAGNVAAITMYGRPWPYMAIVRDRLAEIDPALTDPRVGDKPYLVGPPASGWLEPPTVPDLADQVSFHSPVLTATATGKALNARILEAAAEVYGTQHFRAVMQVAGHPAIAAVFDGAIDGNTFQLVAMFSMNGSGEIEEIRIFSRPWPITAHFRARMYELLKDDLGEEFWQGPDPRDPLPPLPGS